MTGDERGSELPQRVRGSAQAARTAPVSSSAPPLSEELRLRIKAAVQAERAGTAEQARWPPDDLTIPPAADDDIAPPAKKISAPPANKISGKRKQAAAAKAEPVAEPRPVTRAAPDVSGEEEEPTQWLGVQSAATARSSGAGSAQPRPPWPDAAKKLGRRRRRRRLAALAVTVALAASLSAVTVWFFTRSSARPLTAAELRQEAVARGQTAAWVVQNVSRDAPVGCDRVMCAALEAHSFPARDVLQLGPTTPDPFASAAALVVETSAIKSMFGSSLDSAWAPDVLASFGYGPAKVTVRVTAPHGVVAYQSRLNSDLAARKTAGAALLNGSQISIPALAGHQLAAGQVDSRILLALADLASHRPIRVVQFGNDGPGASADVTLRFVDLAENVPAAHLGRAAYVRAVRAFLSQVSVQYRPASMTEVPLADGQPVLRVMVTAPSPLGVFGAPDGP
jgi:hypothetical protein